MELNEEVYNVSKVPEGEKVKLIVMIGLPGSGKSTKRDELKYQNYAYISSDELRKVVAGSEEDQDHNQQVFDTFYKMLDWEMSHRYNTILDATNINMKARRRIFEIIEPYRDQIEVTAYIMNIPIEEVIERDKSRERSVGIEVINKFLNNYQHPQKFEGFDHIILDRPIEFDDAGNNKEFNLLNYLDLESKMNKFDQKNPHHIYSLGEHCSQLNYKYSPFQLTEKVAAIFHDVGKLFTQSIDETGVAHYYNHDNVGTYWLISHLNSWYINKENNLQDILFYINYHMLGHKIKTDKAKNKYMRIFGEDRYFKLLEFVFYDKLASGTYFDKIKIEEESDI